MGIVEQEHLLAALLLHGAEVLLMGCAEVGKHGDGGLYDVAQGLHLSRLADARLEDAHLRVVVHEPNAQRHAYLRVVAAGRARDDH